MPTLGAQSAAAPARLSLSERFQFPLSRRQSAALPWRPTPLLFERLQLARRRANQHSDANTTSSESAPAARSVGRTTPASVLVSTTAHVQGAARRGGEPREGPSVNPVAIGVAGDRASSELAI